MFQTTNQYLMPFSLPRHTFPQAMGNALTGQCAQTLRLQKTDPDKKNNLVLRQILTRGETFKLDFDIP